MGNQKDPKKYRNMQKIPKGLEIISEAPKEARSEKIKKIREIAVFNMILILDSHCIVKIKISINAKIHQYRYIYI